MCKARFNLVFAAIASFPLLSHAFQPPAQPPLPNFDRRVDAAQTNAVTEPQRQAVERLRTMVPTLQVEFDSIIGAPKSVSAMDQLLSGTPDQGQPVSRVSLNAFVPDPNALTKAFVSEQRDLFGHGPEVLDSARLIRDYVTEHNSVRTTVWQQQADGIPVFDAVLISHTSAKGELVNMTSQFVPDADQAAANGTPDRIFQEVAPDFTARQAVALAARNVDVNLSEEELTEVEPMAPGPEQAQKFTAPALQGEADAKLVWLPFDRNNLLLCWDVVLMTRQRGEMFRMLVDVRTGEVHVRRCLTSYITDATYNVYTSDSPSPFSPGWPTPNSGQPPLVSRTLVTWSAMNTNASPLGWINDGSNETWGNNVDAHTDRNADNLPDLPRPQGSPFRVFNFPMDPATQPPTAYSQAAVVQLFYLCNWYHDKLYSLGFTEAAGNFQSNNFGRGGFGNDAVQADAQDGSGVNNANFSTPPDGSPGRMQMYLFTGPTPQRDGDFDAEVVFHEATHGLSWRLVGGGQALGTVQSDGMGEGWSDFYGLTLLSESGDDVNGNYAAGGYVTYQLSGLTQNYYFGIRRYPYSTDMTKNPLTFKDIDPAQASTHAGIPRSPIIGTTANEVHNEGEVWCATLWEARANLINKYGWAVGNQLILQLVTDGMKLTVPRPNFLQARDGILQADQVDTGGANRNELWAAFAKRGMGFSATSPASTTTSGLHESFDIPDDMQINPGTGLFSSGQVGGPFAPLCQLYGVTNTGAGVITWTVTVNQPWVTLSSSGGTLPAGAGDSVNACINSAANSLPVGTYAASVVFSNNISHATITRTVSLDVSPPRVMFFSLDTDPGWARQGQWAFGKPAGLGGTSFGRPDPTSGFSGTNVFGINLSGDYSTAIGGPYYLTAGPFNFSTFIGLQLRFQRWLNADYQPYTFQTLEISTNGTTWTTLWSNGTTAISDSTWTKITQDISAYADRRPTVYIRWGHRIGTSGAVQASGWNLDDIEIVGTTTGPLAVLLPGSVSESAGVIVNGGSIVLANSLPTNLVVSLSSGTPSRLTVPSTVTVLAGQLSASFNVTPINNSIQDGNQVVSVLASAPGFTNVTTTVLVVDDDVPPTIITQPANFSTTVSSTASFSVIATGAPPLSYFWYRNGSLIAGATSATYVTNNVQVSDSGSLFSCMVSNVFGTVTSSSALLTVVPGPTTLNGNYIYLPIATNGVFIANSTGGKFNSAGTGGSLGVDFWYPGTPVYNYVVGVNGIDYVNGAFTSVTVSNASTPTLQRAVITGTVVPGLNLLRDISFAPGSRVIQITDTLQNAGGSTFNNVVFMDSTDPDQDSGFTFSTLNDVLSVIVSNDLVVATGPNTGLSVGFGSTSGMQIPSAVGFDNRDPYAMLTVVDPNGLSNDIDINLVQNYGTLAPGQTRSASWRIVFGTSKTDVINTFATNALTGLGLTVPSSVAENAGVLTNAGTILLPAALPTNLVVSLTSSVPSRLTAPASITILAGQTSSNFNLTVIDNNINDGDQGVTLTAVAGDLNATRSVTVVDDDLPPTINLQPVDQSIPVNGSATFTVNATGSSPISYYWRQNGTIMPGVTGTSFTTNNVPLAASGTVFSCLASNAFGTAISGNATLIVFTGPTILNGNYVYLPIETNGTFIANGTGGRFNSAGTGGSTGVDFWYPGAPVYNYVVGVNGIDYVNGAFTSITVSNASTPTLQHAIITGTVVPGLNLLRDISFAPGSRVIQITDTLQNAGGSTFNNVVLMDTTDPDQDSTPPYNTSLTLNDVVSVNLSNDLVVATGPSSGLSLGLGSNSGMQIPSAVGFDNRDAYAMLTVVDPNGVSNDIDINLVQNYGTLAPGQTRSASWRIVFGTSKTDVINTFATNVLNGLGLLAPPSVAENSGVLTNAGTILLPAALPTNLVVSLTSSVPSRLTVPASITILAGQTSSNFNLTVIDNNINDGDQNVILTAIGGDFTTTRSIVVVDNDLPPAITLQPVSQSTSVNGSATFTINATGASPLSYYWRRNGTIMPGVTGTSFTTNNVPLAASGTVFSCLVSNAFGTAISTNAVLTVFTGPVLLNGNYLYLPIDSNGVFIALSTGGKFNAAGTGGSSGVDFWFPGSPVYNYVVGVGGSSYPNGNASSVTVSNLSSGSLQHAVINSTLAAGLKLTRDVSFDINGKMIKFVDTLQNTTASPLPNVVMLDSTDPDPDATAFGVYNTLNDVVSVLGLNDMVVATGPNSSLSLGFGSESGIQIPSAVGFDNENAYAFLTVVDPNGAIGDIAINLAQNYGTLTAGQSKSLTWYMVFGTSKVDVTNTFASTAGVPPVFTLQPVNQRVSVGCPATLLVDASGTGPLSFQWWKNGVLMNGQTNKSLVLTNLQLSDFTGYFATVTNAFGGTNSATALLSQNHLIEAGQDVIERLPTGDVKVQVFTLLANDIDPDGDTPTFVGVSSNSAAGGTVFRSGNWIYYVPPAGYTNSDAFTYTVTDGFCGGVVSGNVLVQIMTPTGPSHNFVIYPQPDGSIRLVFAGIPGWTYRIQYSDTLSGPNWIDLATRTANPLGVYEYIDNPTNAPMRFYRSVYP